MTQGNSNDILTGSCFCGRCHFVLQRQPKIVAHCLCSICRRVQGAAFGSYAQLPFKYFAWGTGSEAPRAFHSTPSLVRYFCGTCGSHIMHCPAQEPNWAAVSLANVHQALEVAPLAYVHVASKVDWLELPDDGLPRFENGAEPHEPRRR